MTEKEGGGQISTRITEDGQYRLLVEAITDYAIYMLDFKGTVRSWNPGAERFKGYQAAEILGKHFSMFYTLEDRANGEPERAMETATREGRFESQGWRVRKDGSRFWASVVLEPIRAGDGQIVGFAKITRDITRQKETQLALDQAKLALFQSQKMDAIGQLTGGVPTISITYSRQSSLAWTSRTSACRRWEARRPHRQCHSGRAAGHVPDAAHARLCATSRTQCGVHRRIVFGAWNDRSLAVVGRSVGDRRGPPSGRPKHDPH